MASTCFFIAICFFMTLFLHTIGKNASASFDSLSSSNNSSQFSFAGQRFLLFDVNYGEGFNLRRDVYMRVANAVRQLRERGYHFVLVLPPWRNIWHWRKKQREQPESGILWSELFSLEALSTFVPVMEFDQFAEGTEGAEVDSALYLQHYAEGWDETEGYVLKYDVRPCLDEARRQYKEEGNQWRATFSSYGLGFWAKELSCLSIQGQSSTLADAIIKLLTKSRSIMVDRAEVILHDHFGDKFYWAARRSMRYADNLRRIGDAFRAEQFSASDADDVGAESGNYLCAHLRRADFVHSHSADIPSIEGAARQIYELATKLATHDVFICTDANPSEVDAISALLAKRNIRLVRFTDQNGTLSEAAVSIIDRWICAHARHFIGTHLSTFSFRIQEDRELLGQPAESTFNRFCPDGQQSCEQPAKWTIKNAE